MAMKKFRTGVLAGCGLAAAAFSARPAQAATVYNTGFETTEGFSNGALVGQTGGTPARTFAVAPTTPPSDITAAISGGTAVITATNLSSNNNAGGGDAASYYPGVALGTVNTATTPIVTVTSSLAVSATAGTYPGFGLSLFGAGASPSTPIFSVYELGDGTIDYQGSGTATNPATVFTGTNTFSVSLNYLTGTFGLSINNTPFASGAFNNTTGFGTAGLSAATFDSTAGVATGTGTFDNFSVVSAVPEPATGSIVMAGLAVAGLRRRRAVAR